MILYLDTFFWILHALLFLIVAYILRQVHKRNKSLFALALVRASLVSGTGLFLNGLAVFFFALGFAFFSKILFLLTVAFYFFGAGAFTWAVILGRFPAFVSFFRYILFSYLGAALWWVFINVIFYELPFLVASGLVHWNTHFLGDMLYASTLSLTSILLGLAFLREAYLKQVRGKAIVVGLGILLAGVSYLANFRFAGSAEGFWLIKIGSTFGMGLVILGLAFSGRGLSRIGPS